MLLFSEKIKGEKTAFEAEVVRISQLLGINPNWLMFVMWIESNINPAAQNNTYKVKGFPATGLIQFTQDTARGLNTSVEALVKMSGIQQLAYVYSYLLPYRGRMRGFQDVYLAVFFPLALGREDSFILQAKNIAASRIAGSNPAWDSNKDLRITVGEVKLALLKRVPEAIRSEVTRVLTGASRLAKENTGAIGAFFLSWLWLLGLDN